MYFGSNIVSMSALRIITLRPNFTALSSPCWIERQTVHRLTPTSVQTSVILKYSFDLISVIGFALIAATSFLTASTLSARLRALYAALEHLCEQHSVLVVRAKNSAPHTVHILAISILLLIVAVCLLRLHYVAICCRI